MPAKIQNGPFGGGLYTRRGQVVARASRREPGHAVVEKHFIKRRSAADQTLCARQWQESRGIDFKESATWDVPK